SPSPHNGIIGRPRVKKLQAVLSTPHGTLKLPIEGGVITLKKSRMIPLECAMVSESEKNLSITKYAGISRHIAEHRLNVREGCSSVRQKKRGQADDRNQAVQKKVGKLVEAGIIKEASIRKEALNAFQHMMSYLRSRSYVFKGSWVEDAYLGVESYQTKLSLTKPQLKIEGLHLKVYNKLDVVLRDNKLGYGNEGMKDHAWNKKEKEMKNSILEKIEKTLRERRRMRRLECFVGGKRNKTDCILLVRPE
nr:hypothetical protein [Tanacetum cinerariifolium]